MATTRNLSSFITRRGAFAATSGRNSRGYANTLANIIIKNRGLNLEEAEKKYLESISIYTQILGENSPRLADLNIELGRLKFEQDLYDEALAYFLRAQVAYEKSIGTQNAVD
ncbi:MAG: tetratricopeptide repeat protein [Saprospiraceae bacterium]